MKDSQRHEVAQVIAERLQQLNGAELPEECEQLDLIKDLGLDSLDMASLCFDLEESLNVAIPDSAVSERNLAVVGNMVDFILESR